ncbi:hypothetical protein ACU8KH_01080 [Lachancea thermotolerans]
MELSSSIDELNCANLEDYTINSTSKTPLYQLSSSSIPKLPSPWHEMNYQISALKQVVIGLRKKRKKFHMQRFSDTIGNNVA